MKNIDDISYARVPAISRTVCGQSNMVAWTYLRTTFRNVGIRYKLRMDIIGIASLLLSFILLCIHTYQYVVLTNHNYNSNVNDGTFFEALPFFTIYSVQILMAFIPSAVIFAGNISKAAEVNKNYANHADVIASINVNIEQQFSSLADSKTLISDEVQKHLDNLRSFKSNLDTTIKAIKVTDESSPVTILNVPITYELLMKFLTVLGSFGVSLLGLITRVNSELQSQLESRKSNTI